MAVLTASGPWMARTFQRSYAERGQSLTVDFPESETPVWQDALRMFTRKLVARTGRPLVLKSPLHTGRIPALRDLYPQARFVTIFRDPREQLRSLVDVRREVQDWGTVQISSPRSVSRLEKMADAMSVLLRRYFETRGQIPAGGLQELTYEELVSDPLGTLQSLHADLGLPGWPETASRLEASRWWQGYERNTSRPLAPAERELACTAYMPLFEAGYYPKALQELRS